MKRQGGVAEKAPQQVATPGEATALEADVVRMSSTVSGAKFARRPYLRELHSFSTGLSSGAYVGNQTGCHRGWGQPLAQYSIISGQVSVRRDSKCLKILVSRPGLEPGTP